MELQEVQIGKNNIMKSVLLICFCMLACIISKIELVAQATNSNKEYFFIEQDSEDITDSIVVKNPYYNNTCEIIVNDSKVKILGNDDFLELNRITNGKTLCYDLKLDGFEERVQLIFYETKYEGIYQVSISEILDLIPSGLYIDKSYLKEYVDTETFKNMDKYELLNLGKLCSQDSLSYYYKVLKQ